MSAQHLLGVPAQASGAGAPSPGEGVGAEPSAFKLISLHLLINAVPWMNGLFHVSVKRIFLFYSVEILHNFCLICTEA